MDTWKHFNPVRIVAKIDARKELPFFISQVSSSSAAVTLPLELSILLVTSAGMVRRNVVSSLISDIPCSWHVCEVSPEPDLDILDTVIHELREKEKKTTCFSVVIALGGGSVIDSAKALACGLMAHDLEHPLHTWLREKLDFAKSALPLIVLPTTSGTGAEITPFATIWDNKNKKKCSLVSEACFAKVALLDPVLTLSLPWIETLYGALDAFSHALETLWNKTATPMSASCAYTALALIMENLPILEQDLQNISARFKLQESACIAGMAISQSHSSIGHSISYPLTLHYKVQHGLSCSAFLLPIMELVEKHNAWIFPLDHEFKENIKIFLRTYAPHRLVREFCNEEQAQQLVCEMFTPERAGTFVLDLKTTDVTNILKQGFTL